MPPQPSNPALASWCKSNISRLHLVATKSNESRQLFPSQNGGAAFQTGWGAHGEEKT
jgi:hypothetical protein